MVREIVLEPHSILRRNMPDSTSNRKEIARVLQDLRDTLFNCGAVGFAANQIGEETNICIVRLLDDKILELVNPIILTRKRKIYGPESCMSIRNYTAIIPRSEEVQIGYYTRECKSKLITLAPPFSIRAQHEIDHLRGILIRDYVEGKNGKSGGIDATQGVVE